jgi:peptidoglycan hydrolase-like protein with peptidoglycan-binding domain
MSNLVHVPGIENTSEAFRTKVSDIGDHLGIDPNFLMAIMSFETGGSFDPAQRNMAGSGATGLIQFMPKTARSLGTSTEALANMTAEDQLDLVARYFEQFQGRLATLEDTYMAVLFPAAIGKGAGHVLFRRGTTAFRQNRGLDLNGDGEVTVGEATSKVRDRLGGAIVGQSSDLRRGDHGTEVELLQHELIDLGHLTPEVVASGPGTFGPQTEAALAAFQAAIELNPTGVYDATTRTAIAQLNLGVRRGSLGGVVLALQHRLTSQGLLSADAVAQAPGTFGPRTRNGLITFQMDHNLEPNGILNDETYRVLFAHLAPGPLAPDADEPVGGGAFDTGGIASVLPERGPGFQTYNREPGGGDQVGTLSTISAVVALGGAWLLLQPEIPIQVGDISRAGGGPFPPHVAHRRGREVDLRPMRNDGLLAPTTIDDASYDPGLTEALVDLVRATHDGVTILFNDPRLVEAGKARRSGGHHNHLHLKLP